MKADKILLILMMVIVLSSLGSSADIILQDNETQNLQDVTMWNSEGNSLSNPLMKWNITGINETIGEGNLSQIYLCLYYYGNIGSGWGMINVSSVNISNFNNQTWEESHTNNLAFNDNTLNTNLTNSSIQTFNSTILNSFSCINVTEQFNVDYNKNNHFSLYIRNKSSPTNRPDQSSDQNNPGYTSIGLSGEEQNLGQDTISFYSREYTVDSSLRPYLIITYQSMTIEGNFTSHFKLDEGSGTTLYDILGWNNGTSSGATWGNDGLDTSLTENTDYTLSGTTFTLINDDLSWQGINTSYDYQQSTESTTTRVIKVTGIFIGLSFLVFLLIPIIKLIDQRT